jgi:hypothetical protein
MHPGVRTYLYAYDLSSRHVGLSKAQTDTVSTSSRLVLSREFGGADRDRTDDILLAKQALSQLSYSPISNLISLSRLRSEIKKWWAWVDSNYRPHPYQGCALAN